MRLPSILLAFNSIMLGTALAICEQKWHVGITLLALLTAAMLQITANLANDYGDFVRGANVAPYVNPTQADQVGFVSLKQLNKAIVWLVLLTLGAGLLLLRVAALSVSLFVLFALLGLLAIIGAITYTRGPRPYGYAGWGDVSVLFFFGIVGVLGTAYLHTHQWRWMYTLPALSCGCLAVAVLNVNNIRDIQQDAQVGKNTLAVRMGRRGACYYQWGLLLISMMVATAFTILHYHNPWQWLFIGVIPGLASNAMRTLQQPTASLDGVLQQLILIQFFFVVLFSIGLVLSVRLCLNFSG